MKKLSRQEGVLLCAMLAQAAFTFLIALTRYNTFKSSLYDIGVFQQIVALMSAGKAPVTSIVFPEHAIHWFGFHFSPILCLLVPLHLVFSSPVLLIAAQSLLIASSGWITYHAIRLRESDENYVLVWAILFLFNPYLVNAAVNDFHEICFAVPLFAGVAYALLAGRFGWLLFCTLLLVVTKEHYGLAMAGTGVAWAWMHKDYKRGGLLAVGGLILTVLVIFVLMPWFNGGEHPMLTHVDNDLDRYGWLKLPLHDKLRVFFAFLVPDDARITSGASYLMLLFGLSGIIAFLAPIILLPGIADFAANMLSANVMPRGFFAYHSAPLIPLLFVASYLSVVRFKIRQSLVLGSVALLLVIVYAQNNALKYWQIDAIEMRTPVVLPADVASSIPTDAVFSLQSNLGGYLQQSRLYPFPHMPDDTQYVLLSLRYPYSKPSPFLFSSPFGRVKVGVYLDSTKKVLSDPAWCIAYWKDPILLLKRQPCTPTISTKEQGEIDARVGELESVIAILAKDEL